VNVGPSPEDIARANAAAAEARAKAAGKAQTAKENLATQQIIDALLGSLAGYAKGRDTLVSNAQTTYDEVLAGILSNYGAAVDDYEKSADRNRQDESSKSAANVTNRARERTALLSQVLSQGAGETDAMRAILQAFANFDANQAGITGTFYDNERNINAQIAGANSQASTSRRSAFEQLQSARAQAHNEYYKNYTDVWTNIQRTAAQNTNIDSDYSTAFNANFQGKDPVKEAARYAGLAYKRETKDDEYFDNFEGRREGQDTRLASVNRAASTTISGPRRAEGATLRRRA